MKNRLLAWFNLAYRFNRHMVTSVPRRVIGAGNDFVRFVGEVAPEGYLPVTAGERAMLPAAMRCVHCGLCAFAPVAARRGLKPAADAAPPAYSAWEEPWSFVGGASRSIDRAPLVASALPPYAAEAAALCPAGVPIDALAAMHARLAAAEPAAQEHA
jgi:hypothetical protein